MSVVHLIVEIVGWIAIAAGLLFVALLALGHAMRIRRGRRWPEPDLARREPPP